MLPRDIVMLASIFVTLATGVHAQVVRVPDLAREQRMASEIIDAILDGEPLELETAQGRKFLAIHTPSEAQPAKGTVVILHGRGFHPDWTDLVQPLRVGLTTKGWDTLAIQLPVLDRVAKYYDYVEIFGAAIPRIEAATAKARELASGKVVILAHSCGSHMAQHWIETRGEHAVQQFDAFIGIGMGATDYGQPMKGPFALDKIKVPVLDVYAENDFPAVLRLASERLAAMQVGGNPLNAQVVVPDTEHYFVDHGDALLEAISPWLESL